MLCGEWLDKLLQEGSSHTGGAEVHRIEQGTAGDGSCSSPVWVHPWSCLYSAVQRFLKSKSRALLRSNVDPQYQATR